MQRLRTFLCICLLSLGLAGTALPDAAEDAGRKLAQAVYDAPSGDDFASRAVMTLTEKGRAERTREMFTLSVDRGRGERWSLMRFTAPSDIRGVGLLTKDYAIEENDQWLYLPALDRVRRVSSSRKGGRFVGSDLYFEDLQDREVDKDRHRHLGQGKVGGIACEILASVPASPDNSVYTKRISWIHPKTKIALKIEFYQGHSDEPVKRLSVRRIKQIQGFWTVLDSVMEDLATGHSTRMTIQAAKYNQGIPDILFSDRALSDENAEKNYRP